jgi:hypothetical protein
MGILDTLQDALLPSYTAPGYDPGAGEGGTPIDRIESGIAISYATSTAAIGETADITTDIGESTIDVTTDAWEDRGEFLQLIQYFIIVVVGIAGVFAVSRLLSGVSAVTGEEG